MTVGDIGSSLASVVVTVDFVVVCVICRRRDRRLGLGCRLPPGHFDFDVVRTHNVLD
jgi:hypothetical protein